MYDSGAVPGDLHDDGSRVAGAVQPADGVCSFAEMDDCVDSISVDGAFYFFRLF